MSLNFFCTPVHDLFPLLQNEAGDVTKDNIPFSMAKPTIAIPMGLMLHMVEIPATVAG